MNTHQRWARKMTAKPMPLAVELEQQGVDRERRRIRRALMPLLTEARKFCPPHDCGCINCEITKALDAATRAKKGKRK